MEPKCCTLGQSSLGPTEVSHGDAKFILTFQQVDTVQVRLLEQPPEFGLCLGGFYILSSRGHPLPKHFLQVEDGKVGVVLFLLWESGMHQTVFT